MVYSDDTWHVIKSVRGKACEIAHVKGLCLRGSEGLEGIHEAVVDLSAGIDGNVCKGKLHIPYKPVMIHGGYDIVTGSCGGGFICGII